MRVVSVTLRDFRSYARAEARRPTEPAEPAAVPVEVRAPKREPPSASAHGCRRAGGRLAGLGPGPRRGEAMCLDGFGLA